MQYKVTHRGAPGELITTPSEELLPLTGGYSIEKRGIDQKIAVDVVEQFRTLNGRFATVHPYMVEAIPDPVPEGAVMLTDLPSAETAEPADPEEPAVGTEPEEEAAPVPAEEPVELAPESPAAEADSPEPEPEPAAVEAPAEPEPAPRPVEAVEPVIEPEPEPAPAPAPAPAPEPANPTLAELGLGDEASELLAANGCNTAADIIAFGDTTKISGIGKATAAKIENAVGPYRA